MSKMNPDVDKIQSNMSSNDSILPSQTDIVDAMKKVIADRVALRKIMPETVRIRGVLPKLNP